jgi:hypothetical protein
MLILHKTLRRIAISAVFLSGCAQLGQFPAGNDAAIKSAPRTEENPTGKLVAMHDSKKVDIAWILQYYRLISTVPNTVLSDEFERTKNEFSTKKTVWNQWQLAMLLSIPSSSFYDPGRSSSLFKELSGASSEQDPVINDAAFLMYYLVNEQHQIGKKAAALEGQLGEAQSANKTLQDQLDALKAIEENLYQRNKVEVAPKP